MRDPHVVALHYRLETGPQLAFNDPPSVERELDSLSVRLANDQLRIEIKDHFSTVDAACLEVEPYLRSWEIATALQYGPGAMTFVFDNAEVIDRDPTPPGASVALQAMAGQLVLVGYPISFRVTRRRYPEPPSAFVASPDVVAMWERYKGYLEGKEPLPSMAYYCVTAIQHTEARFTISDRVLSRLRCLATMVGDARTLRKRQEGQELRPHTPAEIAWMEAVVKRIIQRVGEWESNHNATWPQITMEEFPRL